MPEGIVVFTALRDSELGGTRAWKKGRLRILDRRYLEQLNQGKQVNATKRQKLMSFCHHVK